MKALWRIRRATNTENLRSEGRGLVISKINEHQPIQPNHWQGVLWRLQISALLGHVLKAVWGVKIWIQIGNLSPAKEEKSNNFQIIGATLFHHPKQPKNCRKFLVLKLWPYFDTKNLEAPGSLVVRLQASPFFPRTHPQLRLILRVEWRGRISQKSQCWTLWKKKNQRFQP